MKKRSLIACGLIALIMGCGPREDDHNHDHGPGHEHDHSKIIGKYSGNNMASLIVEPLKAVKTGPGQ